MVADFGLAKSHIVGSDQSTFVYIYLHIIETYECMWYTMDNGS